MAKQLCATLVSVHVYGVFSHIARAGMPLAICMHLQEDGLQFGQEVWTAKQTTSGFSANFFLETCKAPELAMKKKNKPRGQGRNLLPNPQAASVVPWTYTDGAHHSPASLTRGGKDSTEMRVRKK